MILTYKRERYESGENYITRSMVTCSLLPTMCLHLLVTYLMTQSVVETVLRQGENLGNKKFKQNSGRIISQEDYV
jgi:hypothetical protein